jgi:hypothetical protein
VGNIDGPYYVADIYEYTKKDVDNMVRLTGMTSDKSSSGGRDLVDALWNYSHQEERGGG